MKDFEWHKVPVWILSTLVGVMLALGIRNKQRAKVTPPPVVVAEASAEERAAERVDVSRPPVRQPPGDIERELRVSAGPPPKHDVADVVRRLRQGETGTYLPHMLKELDSTLYRWPDRVAQPLRVWIDPRPPLFGWSEDNPGLVRSAFEEWAAIGLPLRFSFVVNAGDADVSVKWVDKFEGDRIGYTRWVHDQYRWLTPGGEIILALHDARGQRLPPDVTSGIARHEIGHLLGLPHSPNTTDVMYPQLMTPTLSQLDRATARLLYSVPAGSVRMPR